MRCPNCNNEIPEGKRFCGHCGHLLESIPVPERFDDESPTRMVPPEPIQPLQPAPATAPPPATKGCLPRWAIGLIGGLGLVAVVAAIVVVVPLVLRGPGEEQAAPAAAAATATPAPTPTPDIESLLTDAIDRANQAEIDALRTLDTSVLEGNVTGDMLEIERKRVESLQEDGRYKVSTQISVEFLSFEIADDETHAQVESLEIWRSEVYRRDDDVLVYVSLPNYVPQTYSLVKVDGHWLVEEIEFHHDPDHIPDAEGLEVVYELVEQRDWGQGVEAIVVMLLVENSTSTNLASAQVFITFYDEDGEELVHRQTWCNGNPLEAEARTFCHAALTSDREGYPMGWQSYELKPVGVPTEDEPVVLTLVEERLLEDTLGNPYVTGWLRNDDHRNAYVSGTPIFYDERGRFLEGAYAEMVVEGTVFEPGDAAAFQIAIPEGWDGSSYELRWHGSVTGVSPRMGFAVENVVQEDSAITGQLRNTSGDVEEYVVVNGLFYDAANQLIAVQHASDTIRMLSPGESEGFTIDFPSQVAEEDVARYELIVE